MEIKMLNSVSYIYYSMSVTPVKSTCSNNTEYPSEPVTGEWIHVNDLNPHTYVSSNIRSFRCSDDEGYQYGKLIIRFQDSGSYIYDLPKNIFDQMAKRAFNPDDFKWSTGEWYSNTFHYRAEQIHGFRDKHYEMKIDK
jgi:pyrrolidone-carboxylate peptidase